MSSIRFSSAEKPAVNSGLTKRMINFRLRDSRDRQDEENEVDLAVQALVAARASTISVASRKA